MILFIRSLFVENFFQNAENFFLSCFDNTPTYNKSCDDQHKVPPNEVNLDGFW